MPMPKRCDPGTYGETKKARQFLITPTSSKKLDEVAEELGITRSEVVEKMIRLGGLDAVRASSALETA